MPYAKLIFDAGNFVPLAISKLSSGDGDNAALAKANQGPLTTRCRFSVEKQKQRTQVKDQLSNMQACRMM
jgi:hypothetical protein